MTTISIIRKCKEKYNSYLLFLNDIKSEKYNPYQNRYIKILDNILSNIEHTRSFLLERNVIPKSFLSEKNYLGILNQKVRIEQAVSCCRYNTAIQSRISDVIQHYTRHNRHNGAYILNNYFEIFKTENLGIFTFSKAMVNCCIKGIIRIIFRNITEGNMLNNNITKFSKNGILPPISSFKIVIKNKSSDDIIAFISEIIAKNINNYRYTWYLYIILFLENSILKFSSNKSCALCKEYYSFIIPRLRSFSEIMWKDFITIFISLEKKILYNIIIKSKGLDILGDISKYIFTYLT